MRAQELPRARVGAADERRDLGVEDLGRRLADGRRAAEERIGGAELAAAVGADEAERAETLAHAVLPHHVAGDLRRALDVVVRAGRDLVEDELLGRAPAEEDGEPVLELGLALERAVLDREAAW